MFTILMEIQRFTFQLRLVTVPYFVMLSYRLITRIDFADELGGSCVVNVNFYVLTCILQKNEI